MGPDDRWAVLLVLVLSVGSMTWSWWEDLPYWSLLSIVAAVLAVRSLWGGRLPNQSTVWMSVVSLIVAPMFSILVGTSVSSLLEVLISPLLAYSIALWLVTTTLTTEDGCGTGTVAFITLLAATSIGTLALLSLYYADALFFTDFLPSNSAMMWPLLSLVAGSISISAAMRITGYEETIMCLGEVES